MSTRSDYALSCIIRVAAGGGRPVQVREVASKEKIEPDYVEQLFVIMKRYGILKSLRGRKGGYILAARPRDISARDVVTAIDRCVLELVCDRRRARRIKCVHLRGCRVRSMWEKLKQSMELVLEDYTLDRLLGMRKKEKCWK